MKKFVLEQSGLPWNFFSEIGLDYELCIPAKLTPHSGKLTPHCLRLSIAYPTVKVIYFFSWIHL